jgi:[protein-PII] uridylyltransferase
MPVYLEKVLRHAERELVNQSHLRPTDLLDIYRRFLKLEEHRLKLEHRTAKAAANWPKSAPTSSPSCCATSGTRVGNAPAPRTSTSRRASRCSPWAASAGANSIPTATSTFSFSLPRRGEERRPGQRHRPAHSLHALGHRLPGRPRHAHPAGTRQPGQRRPPHQDLAAGGPLISAETNRSSPEFEKTFERRCLHGHEKEFLEWRVADQRDRHEKAGNTVFLQEPNVKNGCGGLRDYQNLIWVGKVKRGLANTQQMSTRNCSPRPNASSSTAPTTSCCASAPNSITSKSVPATS